MVVGGGGGELLVVYPEDPCTCIGSTVQQQRYCPVCNIAACYEDKDPGRPN